MDPRVHVRLVSTLLALALLSPFAVRSAKASGPDDAPMDAASLVSLESKAASAEVRDQCFLYTELLHGWTELAGRAMQAGDDSTATLAIQHADADAQKLKAVINHDSKRLKNAELLLEHSVHRFSDMLHASTVDQHDTMQAVLRHMTSVHDELLAAVFAH